MTEGRESPSHPFDLRENESNEEHLHYDYIMHDVQSQSCWFGHIGQNRYASIVQPSTTSPFFTVTVVPSGALAVISLELRSGRMFAEDRKSL